MRNPRTTGTLTARKIGNWDEAIKFIDKLGYNIKPAAIKAQRIEANEIKRKVVLHMLKQDLPWEPLSKSTIARKKQNKNLVYLDTEKYMESIRVWTNHSRVFVGVPKGILYKKGGRVTTVDQVAIWMEYGTPNRSNPVPARPIWNPTIQEVGGARGIRDRV